jgi:hypothetical protein
MLPIDSISSPEVSASLPRVALKDARLDIDPASYSSMYNRIPFGFSHNLHQLDIFQFDAIRDLAERYSNASENDFYVAESAAAAGSAFFEAAHIKLRPKEAMQQLDERPTRILLKRLENHDSQFKALIDILITQLRALPGGLGNQPIRRIQSSLFITSAASTTPLHFDPEVAFFTQIEGDKAYHAYPPNEVTEPELEDFYAKGRVSIGQLDITKLHPEQERLFNLKAGHGFHQPQNSPHWVQTGGIRSISYSCVFETSADRALGRTRAFNHFERMLGMNPTQPGTRPQLDAVKSEVIGPVRFARKVVSKLRNG